MFKQARIKLTFFYSSFFLLIFWIISLFLYFWMQQFFQQQYEQQVRDQIQHVLLDPFDVDPNWSIAAATIAFDQFRNILLIVNLELLVLVPASAYLLTGRSLKPIEEAHVREKQFVANVAHDLRTPLTIMNGELEVALQKKRAITEYQGVVQSTKEEVKRLNELVEQLLFLANQDAKNQQIGMDKIDLIDVVSAAFAGFSPKMKRKKIKTELLLPEESIQVTGNATMLRQLFSNLIDNAVKYTYEKGTIAVTVGKKDHTATVSIKDTGIGIEESEQEKIFDRFYRVDTSRSQTKGYGLGLAICRTIVNIHHGHLEVRSKKDAGTMFTVVLPITQDQGRSHS